jgi:HSP20 family protein
MLVKKETPAAPIRASRDPFALLRQMTSNLERIFEEPFAFNFPTFARAADTAAWVPEIDVFEKDNHLITEIDLPGLKKEDVKVEVTDGQLVISGERKTEAEEKKENFYRCERNYGAFYRTVPLPEGVKVEDVKATFTNGVLEVSMPLPVKAQPKSHKVEIGESPAPAKAAAA